MKTGYKVSDAMTKKAVVILEDITVKECAEQMHKFDVGNLLVMKNKKLVGIITEEDLVRKIVALGKDAKKTKAKDVMTKKLITIEPNRDIYDALLKMNQYNIRRLPVVSHGKLEGILTIKDILKIQPHLFDIVVERYRLMEEEFKPIYGEKGGICQNCGDYVEHLIEHDTMIVCSKCLRELE